MISSDQIKESIEASIPCEWIQVEGEDGRHFNAVIVSAEFVGKTMIQQHQLVYRALRERMKDDVHALSMRTLTPEQWVNAQSSK